MEDVSNIPLVGKLYIDIMDRIFPYLVQGSMNITGRSGKFKVKLYEGEEKYQIFYKDELHNVGVFFIKVDTKYKIWIINTISYSTSTHWQHYAKEIYYLFRELLKLLPKSKLKQL